MDVEGEESLGAVAGEAERSGPGCVQVAGMVSGGEECDGSDSETIRRKRLMREVLEEEIEGSVLSGAERDQLWDLLQDFHDVFSLERGVMGGTDLVEMHIEAEPRKQQVLAELYLELKHYGVRNSSCGVEYSAFLCISLWTRGHSGDGYHSAVRAVRETPSPSGKNSRWWLKVFGCGVGKVRILYRPGRENDRADALSRNPLGDVHGGDHLDLGVQVSEVRSSEVEIAQLLEAALSARISCLSS